MPKPESEPICPPKEEARIRAGIEADPDTLELDGASRRVGASRTHRHSVDAGGWTEPALSGTLKSLNIRL